MLSDALRVQSRHCAESASEIQRKNKETLRKHNPKSGWNWCQNLGNSEFRGGLEVLGDPPGDKMAQDASRVASGAPFLEILGLILAPRWPKKTTRWTKLEPS